MKLLKWLFIPILALSLTTTLDSCSGGKFVFVTKYSQAVVDRLNTVSEKTATLYSTIAIATDKHYVTWEPNYDEVSTLLTSLLETEKGRPKNKAITAQAQISLDLFTKYKGEHRATDTISASKARVYASYMKTSFNSWKVSEKSLNK